MFIKQSFLKSKTDKQPSSSSGGGFTVTLNEKARGFYLKYGLNYEQLLWYTLFCQKIKKGRYYVTTDTSDRAGTETR